MTILLFLLPATMIFGMISGPLIIPAVEVINIMLHFGSNNSDQNNFNQNVLIVESIRLPRVCLAALIGMLLASCGAVLQGLFRNPLADPTLIGVSAGASAGASLAIVFGSSQVLGEFSLTSQFLSNTLPVTAFGAFIGGLITSILVYKLATNSQGTSVATMLLAGIAISALAGAINSLLNFFADNEMLRRLSLWRMGNLDNATWERVMLCFFAVLLLILLLPKEGRALNAILLGESEARHLGFDVEKMKRRLIILTALGVGVAIAMAGTIAFLGIVIPHLIRLLIGPDHRYLLPASAIGGAILLVLADTLARILIPPAEIPAGIITAVLGAPFFIWLLLQQRQQL